MLRLLLTFLLILSDSAPAELSKTGAQQPRGKEVTKLREELIKSTIEYRASLQKLLVSYQKNVQRAQQRLTETKKLRVKNLLEDRDVDSAVRALADANENVKNTEARIAATERQIADNLPRRQVRSPFDAR